jgi:hypothetical protein
VTDVADKRRESQDIHFVLNTYCFSTATLVTRTRLCYVIRTVKVKANSHEEPEGEWRNSSTFSLTLALDGGGWSAPCRGRFTLGKDPVPILYGPQSRSGRLRKISPPSGFDPRTVQPVVSRYTDYALPAPHVIRAAYLVTCCHVTFCRNAVLRLIL